MKTVHQNQTVEWSFRSGKEREDPFNEMELAARFTHENGEEKLVPAFWTGSRNWRVRFASPQTGAWRFQTVCSDSSDAGLHEQEGDFEVRPYTGKNPLYRHGPIQIGTDHRHFQHADGTPFFWLGDTWWMGLTKRLTWPTGFKTLARDRVKKGFTVVQIVAGLYPDMPAFDPRGANEAGFPWEQKYERINPKYFDLADRRLQHLVESGIVPCIVGCWGYFLPWMGVEKMKRHWRNLVARYGAYPTFWCLAGEVIMPYYLSTNKEADREFQRKGWNELVAYVKEIDPYRRPITVHPGSSGRRELEDPVNSRRPERCARASVWKGTHVLAALTDGWRFKTDPADVGEAEAWHRAPMDDAWKPIRITASWQMEGYAHYGAAWYVVECPIPAGVKNPVHLLFHAVDGTAKVWIDGQFAGEQTKSTDLMWNRPWAVDVSRHVALKRSVRIAIKVVKLSHACGIYNPVELREECGQEEDAAAPAAGCEKAELTYESVRAIEGSAVLDFDMLQTGHDDRSSLPNTVKQVCVSYRTTPTMPVVNGEVCYEGIGEFCPPSVQRLMFWACMLNGAAGFTYGANGIWQVNTRKRPYGPSPHGTTWGNTPWEDAHHLPGAGQLGLAKRLLTRYPFWQFEPHPEWVEPGWTEDLLDAPFTGGRHDIPMAAGIPGKVRIIYRPLSVGLRRVKGIEKDVRYRFRLFNPVDGSEVKGGEVKPDAEGNWNTAVPVFPNWHPTPIFQDWVIVMEAKGGKLE